MFPIAPIQMAAMNSAVLACNYAISGADLSAKVTSLPPSVASPPQRLPLIRAQQSTESGRRAALFGLGAALFTAAAAASANAGVIDDYLEKSKANKVGLNFAIFTI